MQPHLPWITKRQPLPSYCSQTGWKIAPALFTERALATRMFVLYLEIILSQKCATCHSFTSNSFYSASHNMGHTHLSSLEQSCQGATYCKQPILIWENETRPITSGNLEFKTASTIPSLEPPTERILPKMAKIDKLPKESRNKVINAMPSARCLFTSPVFLNLVVLCRHQSTQAFLPSFFPMLDLLVYVLPFFSSTWLPPLLFFISSSRPLLLPFYSSTFSSFQPRSREFAISPWPMQYANNKFGSIKKLQILAA